LLPRTIWPKCTLSDEIILALGGIFPRCRHVYIAICTVISCIRYYYSLYSLDQKFFQLVLTQCQSVT